MGDRYDKDRYRGERQQDDRWRDRDERGFMERASDEVRSWFGDEEAERRRRLMDDRDWNEREHRGWREREWRDRDPGDRERRAQDPIAGAAPDWRERNRYSERWEGRDYGNYRGREQRNWRDWNDDRPRWTSGRGYGSTTAERPAWRRPVDEHDWRSGESGSEQSWRGDYLGAYGSREAPSRVGGYAGRGPKGYQRPDARIQEDASDRLADAPDVDATNIMVAVTSGEVTLTGFVHDRWQKHRAEDLVESISGVKDVNNQLRVQRGDTTASFDAAG